MRGIDISDVEARSFGAQGGIAMPAAHFTNVGQVHGPGLERVASQVGHARDTKGNLPCTQVGDAGAAQAKLDPCQGTVCMNLLGHQSMGPHIAVVPQGCTGMGRIVDCGVHGTVFSVDHSPAAFGLHLA